jgi:hypothetical protein
MMFCIFIPWGTYYSLDSAFHEDNSESATTLLKPKIFCGFGVAGLYFQIILAYFTSTIEDSWTDGSAISIGSFFFNLLNNLHLVLGSNNYSTIFGKEINIHL